MELVEEIDMYVTEAMIASMEDMQKNAGDMEKHIKAMMETEARMHGLELDSRHNARDMWHKLSEHMAQNIPAPAPEAPPEPIVEPIPAPIEDTLPSDVEPPAAPMPSPANHQESLVSTEDEPKV